MEQALTSSAVIGFPLSQRFEYSLVAPCKDEIFLKIREEQQKFLLDYKVQRSKTPVPNFTIANFLASEEMEETVIRWLRRIISEQRRFSVMLNNYGGVPSHCIYARVQDNSPFKRLTKALHVIDQYVRSNGCPPAKLISNPNIAIAGKLSQEIFEKAMRDYSRKTFYALFVVNELHLLKRKTEYDEYRQVSVFKLSQQYPESFN